MQQSSSLEANRFSASQEIPCILWNLKVHYCIHLSPSPVPLLNQINPAHILKIHFHIILSCTRKSSKWSPSLRFPHRNPVYTSALLHLYYMPHQSYCSWFNHLNNIWWGVQIIKLLIMWFSLHPVTLPS